MQSQVRIQINEAVTRSDKCWYITLVIDIH